ncbi:DeoR/GlpR transcriptional regulator [Paenibacillus sp. HN-1]|uniref:DeoR/GlpR family DNA-binding transcription regulator n=1 Tax=Paenibacillus TaxID=44249 RepID=UPI001CA9807B|nr:MULTISPECIES: DeoR/GlpR family DNA-binding transcription regulator [Paenibacillus]MBY9081370.1 DeoR/GlpR transcriptional regulator [Paenibacillus sp. CGMCC 1.18879]MBY9084890.1 DeoR/GlpR transcriptional regulator [Paenibacillus sinensis]
MFQIERVEKILEYINRKKKANVKELSEQFEVSKVTIRRDLDELAEKGLVVKTHGGVMSIMNKFAYEIPIASKFEANSEAKKKIGALAASLIEEGDIVVFDAGSTTLEIAKSMKTQDITVLTNDIKISMEVAMKPNVKLMVSGGALSDSVYTLVGDQTVEFFKKVHVNKTFLGCDAIDLEFGISNRTREEVPAKKAMIDAAEEVIMVTDDSKHNTKVFCYLCEISKIDKLITNRIDDHFRLELEKNGVEVLIAE